MYTNNTTQNLSDLSGTTMDMTIRKYMDYILRYHSASINNGKKR